MATNPGPHSPTIGSLVWRLSMRWRASVDRAVAPHGLTHASYSVLASLFSRLESGSAPSQRELAELIGLEPAYMSKLVRILERDGYVRRAEHPDDTRAVQLTLTRAGRRTVEAAIATVQALHDELLAPLGGPAERARASGFKAELQILLHDIPHIGGTP